MGRGGQELGSRTALLDSTPLWRVCAVVSSAHLTSLFTCLHDVPPRLLTDVVAGQRVTIACRQTNVTDYGVRQSPYLNGTADIVRDFVAACHRGGVSPCLYFIPPMDTYESNVKVIEPSHCKMTLPRSLLRFTKTQSHVHEVLLN